MYKAKPSPVASTLTVLVVSSPAAQPPFSCLQDGLKFLRRLERKTVRILALAFAVSLASFSVPTTAWAADVFHFDGNSAIAQFYSVEPSGCDCGVDPVCVSTGVFVFAADNKSQSPPGPPDDSASSANLFIFKSSCEAILLNAACFPPGAPFASLADKDWQVSGGLNSATLRTRLECSESVSGTPFEVDVDLRWEGIGPLSRGTHNTNSSTPGCKVSSHTTSTFRPTLESGTVFDGITNFTPHPSVPDTGDNIAAGKGSQLLIGCQ